MILPTGQDENNYMIYETDGRTIRVYFKRVNGRMVRVEETAISDLIPGEHPLCFHLLHC